MKYKRFGSRMVLRIDRGEEVLTQLPDEQMANIDPVGGELANKYDPSHGYVDDNDEKPYDPWEDGANDPDIPVVAGFDINALRAKAAKKPKKA